MFAKCLAECLACNRYSPKIKYVFVSTEETMASWVHNLYFHQEQKTAVCHQVFDLKLSLCPI